MTGCKNNRYELDQIILWAAKNSVEFVTDEGQSDFCIINTCTVTHVADKKSRQLIRKTKNRNKKLKMIVFGCGARMQKEEFEKIDEIDYLLPDLPAVLGFLNKQLSKKSAHKKGSIPDYIGIEMVKQEKNDKSRSRALVQIQDGCDNFCTYCITVLARGRSQNRSVDEIIDEVNHHIKNGFNEVVLTGINIGAYGCSKTTKPEESKLAELLHTILDKTTIKRVRLTSMGPEYFFKHSEVNLQPSAFRFNNLLFEILKNPRICRHIHLAIQSGSDDVLEKMRRNYSVKQMDAVIERLKKDIPGIAITSDIIVGFPDETDENFKETVEFVKRNKLAKVHVFPYSIREGTAAATMKQIPDAIKKKRVKDLQLIAEGQRKEFIESQIGKKVSVLWEKESGALRRNAPALGLWEGLTDNYIRVRKKGDYAEKSVTDEVLTEGICYYLSSPI